MEPPPFAAYLLAQRKGLGLSQEEPAATAGLGLRTVQRLENGETLPRGYTLQALAQAMQVPVGVLTSRAYSEPGPPAPEASALPPGEAPAALSAPPAGDVPAYVALMYLSALSYALLPGANIVLPLLPRCRKRHVAEIREAGSRLLNFELTWTLVTYGRYLLLLAG